MLLLRRFAGQNWLRQFSSEAESRSGTLVRWLQEWMAVPRVVVPEGTEPPTALSWLRRRGPPLPEAAVHRLFRQKTVRLYDPTSQKVGRVAKGHPLPPGSMLLLPKAAVAEASAGQPQQQQQQQQERERPASGALARQRAAAAAAMRGALLHVDPDFLAVNKPGGLATQGGHKVAASVDAVMAEAFAGLPGVDAAELRLVHRLDRDTTGVLLLARSRDSAAWLSAAFQGSTSSHSGSGGGGSGPRAGRRPAAAAAAAAAAAEPPYSIQKTYWAVVARPQSESEAGRRRGSSGGAWLPAAGSVAASVRGRADSAQLQAAHTRYRVLHQSEGLAWLELFPGTGRKHQIRVHCAEGLGAPVLGDSRYGAVRSPAQEAALQAASQAAAAAQWGSSSQGVAAFGSGSSSPPLFLHCRSMCVRRPRKAVSITAPLPEHWRTLLAQQGWPLPPDSAPSRPTAFLQDAV